MNEFVVYALYSKDYNKIYIGYSSDFINRFQSHNHFGKKGFTSRFRPWKVVHVEFYNEKTTAMKREKSLKSAQGREFIRKVVLDY